VLAALMLRLTAVSGRVTVTGSVVLFHSGVAVLSRALLVSTGRTVWAKLMVKLEPVSLLGKKAPTLSSFGRCWLYIAASWYSWETEMSGPTCFEGCSSYLSASSRGSCPRLKLGSPGLLSSFSDNVLHAA
jgi:hypothetical protein